MHFGISFFIQANQICLILYYITYLLSYITYPLIMHYTHLLYNALQYNII